MPTSWASAPRSSIDGGVDAPVTGVGRVPQVDGANLVLVANEGIAAAAAWILAHAVLDPHVGPAGGQIDDAFARRLRSDLYVRAVGMNRVVEVGRETTESAAV